MLWLLIEVWNDEWRGYIWSILDGEWLGVYRAQIEYFAKTITLQIEYRAQIPVVITSILQLVYIVY